MISVVKGNVRKRVMSNILFIMAAMVVFSGASVSDARGEIICRAEVNRTSVPVGGDVILTVTAEGSVDWSADFEIPTIPGVSIRAGGTNQSMSFINGRSSTTISRTYYLRVEKQSDFVVGKIKVSSGKDSGESDPIAITVTAPDPTGGVPTSQSGNRLPRPSGTNTGSNAGTNKDVFVTLEVDQDEVWVGQQIILSFKYWHRGQSWSSPQYQAPKTEGFWREDLGKERSYQKSYQGWTYNVTEINYALFPTRSGSLNIEPAVLEFSASNGFFFGSRRRVQTPKSFKTDAITVNVKPLPLPRPADFSGIAGSSLDFVAKVNRTNVPAGESVTYSIELMTDGFLKSFSGLEVEAPVDCRLHDGTENLETLLGNTRQRNAQKLIGRYSQEKFIVPTKSGSLKIPGQKVSWFNVRTGKYQTTQTKTQQINVTAARPGTEEMESSGFRRSEIERLGEDLAFINQVPDHLIMRSPVFTRTPLYWICLVLPILGLGSWRLYVNKLATDRRNPAKVRRRRALVTALRELKKTEVMQESEERFGAISRVVSGYVADVENRPLAAIGGQDVRDFCIGLGLEEHGVKLESYLHTSDFARYGGTSSSVETSAAEVKTWLTDLDLAFKKQNTKKAKNSSTRLASFFLLMCLGFLNISSGHASDQTVTRPGPDPVRLLAEGNQAYTAGDIVLAIDLYTQALDLGVDDSVLHYNIGNAYARQGQLGRAVVSYLRARRLAPQDKDISGNLHWVRSQLQDLELQDHSMPLFIAEVVTVIGWFTLAQWSYVPLLLVWALAILVGWGWYRDDFSNGLRRLIIVSVALFIISSGITGWRYYLEEVRDQAVIVVAKAAVYSGPADSYPVLFEVHDGLTVNLNESRDGWVRMDLGGQWQGWVPSSSVEPVRLP